MNDKTQLTETNKTSVAPRGTLPAATSRVAPMVPPVDVVEDSHGITLWADLPGVTRDKLDIRVEGPNLFIEAEAVVPTPAEMRLQHAEVLQPRYARAFALSGDFDSTKIEANLKNGVLRLTVPRREEARPRRIEVTAS
ncbi:Hsp20/alpha crystallin family protein [Caballeronia sp. LZ001]|uniref:Hsp20/alpha crystallin family protein n=1 Tax=Caballeronia sp. LZ001 TaxID=3038553 RepID=UPI002859A9EB|nr:Hsp20/alpha crystallin family protein [Caballeronia sp. LZ001]MDR5806634.1 Hsp20/alpha crystallin family protein [Caballeronia sp. LZ001]